ncbi:MAG TPA: hypothetical protein PKZ41_00945, partial [Candidatus Omnitrophota bacterium]|nr:hypothetical protein [Candidatus Omnitrophota bacterium]
ELKGGFDSSDIEKSFVRAGTVKRFPLDVELKDLILVPSDTAAGYSPKILRFGDFFERCSENTVIAHLQENLGFSYDDIFESITELYSREDAVRFMKEAYRREQPGSEMFYELQERIEETLCETALSVGLPGAVFGALSAEDLIETIEANNGVNLVPVTTGDDGYIKEALSSGIGPGRGVAVLMDSTAFPADISSESGMDEAMSIIDGFCQRVKLDITPGPGQREMEFDSVTAVAEREESVRVVFRSLPEGRSYDLGNKSLRQIVKSQSVMEELYDSDQIASLQPVMPREAEQGKGRSYLVHFADGEEIVEGAGPIIVPPGLEIAKRRREQGVIGRSDVLCRDKFFVVVPKGISKPDFKKYLMELWMLDGVVNDSKVVILDRKEEGYSVSELFGLLEGSSAKVLPPTAHNTGFRYLGRGDMLKYDTNAGEEGLLCLGLSADAVSSMSQYEVLYNLIAAAKSGSGDYSLEGLTNVGERHFVYGFPRATFIDIEHEIKRYYELYREEVLIKA